MGVCWVRRTAAEAQREELRRKGVEKRREAMVVFFLGFVGAVRDCNESGLYEGRGTPCVCEAEHLSFDHLEDDVELEERSVRSLSLV